MKLNKPLITICLIILLVINLIFFSFLSIGRKTKDRVFVENTIEKFIFKEYLLNSYNIKNSIDEFNYPKEVFNYLDDMKISNVKSKIVDNLFNKSEVLVDKNEIIEILNESVHEFESNRSRDIYSYVEKDILEFANVFENKINNDFLNSYSYIGKLSNSLYFISIIISIASIIGIIILEKTNAFLITSIILIIYSFFTYYFNNYFLDFVFKNKTKYFDKINLGLDDLYIICFIIGFVLLLIYIIKILRKTLRNIRISSYNRR